MEEQLILFVLFLLVATLYSSVGHAGASGYLAVMALLSFAPASIKPTSLILNIIVALIASFKFIRAGCFDRRIFLSFIISSIPLAFIGGQLTLEPRYFKLVAGIFLILSAFLLLARTWIIRSQPEKKEMPLIAGLVIGAVIGIISGLIGVGGGIFLSPIIILAGWTTVRDASGVAALFILCNSIAALAGHITALNAIDPNIPYWIVAVVIGGIAGSWFGIRKFGNRLIITCLFLVLLSAGVKFIFVDAAV